MGASAWAADYLTRHPLLLDELLDARALLAEPDWDVWRDELARQMAGQSGDVERQMDTLRHFQHAQTFRLLAQDLGGRLTVERLADHLSALADVLLAATLDACWAQLAGPAVAAAALRDHRLRQTGRQGIGLRVRPRSRVPVRRRCRRSRSRSAAGALRPPRAAPHHVAHQQHGRRPALRHRPAPAPGRRVRAARVEPRRLPQVSARKRVDLGTSGADPRALRRRRCRSWARRSKPNAKRSCACPRDPRTLARDVGDDAAQDGGRSSQSHAAVRSQARPGRHGRHRVRRAVPGAGACAPPSRC